MTLQNRVTPFGDIVAVAPRGMLMGNRGCLHDDQHRLVRTQASRKDWVTCRLQFKDRRRPLMAPGKYTELFFLDEVTALAAGHRPCHECRRDRFVEFRQAWAAGVIQQPDVRLLVGQIDPVLHRDRLASRGVQRRFPARVAGLPDGVIVQIPGESGVARLLWRGRLMKWTAAGYEDPWSLSSALDVEVLTPACTAKALTAGYVPEVHPSAG